MLVRKFAVSMVALAVMLSTASAHAHFLWLFASKNADGQPVVKANFGEGAEDAEPEFLPRLKSMKVWHRPEQGETTELKLKETAEFLEAPLPENLDAQHPGVVLSELNFGVTGRGEKVFLLQYYAKVYPGNVEAVAQLGPSKPLKLDIIPTVKDKTLTLQVTFHGKPVAGSEVVVNGAGLSGDKLKTDDAGTVSVELKEAGLLEIRARHIEATPGQYQGKDYQEIRNYCTLTMPWSEKATAAK